MVLNRELADQRFLEPGSGAYWQISGNGFEPFPSRSLWDRKLRVDQRHDDRRAAYLRQRRVRRQNPADRPRSQRSQQPAAAYRRARREAPGLAGPLEVPGGAEPRRARRADRDLAADPGAQLRAARPRADRDGRRCRPGTACGRCAKVRKEIARLRAGKSKRIEDRDARRGRADGRGIERAGRA